MIIESGTSNNLSRKKLKKKVATALFKKNHFFAQNGMSYEDAEILAEIALTTICGEEYEAR